MTPSSGSAASVISLPKGGGALNGIGETFRSDPFTGTGSFTVPLTLPPGRNGLAPALSLSYDTGNGNGPFGVGWALSVPSISRKTSRGVPRYDESDVFVLSGAEDLVPVARRGDRTQYRPRTEGLFARIERIRTGSSDDYWEVATKDGLISRYGTAAAAGSDPAAVADPANRRRVFSWRLTETRDPFGNRIVYEYVRDSATQGPRSWDQLYLKRIRYVDFERAGAADFLASVEFFYSFERAAAALAPWAASIRPRDDPSSDYRATFEIRTRHRCALILVRTHADPATATPVRAYRLTYLDERGSDDAVQRLPANAVSLLSRVHTVGYRDDGTPESELPPLDFSYTVFEPETRRFTPIHGEQAGLPSLALPNLDLVDLHGSGLPDILEMAGTARYWRNLGGGRFAPPQLMRESPLGLSLDDAGVALLDANGDGRADLMVHRPELTASFSLEFGPRWRQRPARGLAPSFSLQDPEVRLIDLDGDGVTDALRTGTRFECFFNDRDEGWRTTTTVARGRLEDFPDVSFSDQRVRLADMSGDGLQDVVLVHDGNVEYWPNRGRGTWSRRISMRGSPSFPNGYDPRRVLLGDLDGDGLSDLIYVDRDRVVIWFNQAGNGWSAPTVITGTPAVTDVDTLRIVDLYGRGTPGVLFSTGAERQGRPSMYFLDLTGGIKPYVLAEMDNNMGARTRVTYRTSTDFYLDDAASPSLRWATPLPFPVHVVSRVEVIDALSKGKLTTEYRYHHGYWDGAEREFRGFGLVEQFDSEGFDVYHRDPTLREPEFAGVPRKYFSPPMLTRSWFHQGAVGDEFGAWAEQDYSGQGWFGDPPLLGHTEAINRFLAGGPGRPLVRRDRRDALRALRGNLLRTEVYAMDGSTYEHRPYSVTEVAYSLHDESPSDERFTGPRIFFPHEIARRVTQWERGDDPLTVFSFLSDYDPFGHPRQATTAAMPRRQARRRGVEGAVVGVVQPDETRVLATHTLTRFAQPPANGRYIHDRICQTHTFEGATSRTVAESVPDDVTRVLRDQHAVAVELHRIWTDALKEWTPGTAVPGSLKLIAHAINHYDGPAFVGRDDEVVVFGARTRSETLVFTDALLNAAYADPNGSRRPTYLGGPAAQPAGAPAGFGNALGYTRRQRAPDLPYQDGYYADSERKVFDFQRPGTTPQGWAAWPARGALIGFQDSLRHETAIELDRFWLQPVRAEDPVGLEVQATHNYRTMQPDTVVDPNGNAVRFRYTAAGLPEKSWVVPKPDAAGAQAGGTEAKPELEWRYDFLAYMRSRGTAAPAPISVRTRQRLYHASDNVSDEIEETIEYSDGFGRIIQKRARAPRLVFGVSGDQVGLLADQTVAPGVATATLRDPHVIVSAWQIHDNRGQPVEVYEPFFSQTWSYQDDATARQGPHAEMYYDPQGAVVRTIRADGSQQRVVRGRARQALNLFIAATDVAVCPAGFEPTPWERCSYDGNDLAPASVHPTDLAADGSAAPLAGRAPATHHYTPRSSWIDALSRTICQVERNGSAGANWHVTRTRFDTAGNTIALVDAFGRDACQYIHDMASRALRVETIDAGVRTSVIDACGKLVEYRDSKGSVVLREYDALNRIERLWARNDAAGTGVTLRERTVYGDRGVRPQTAAETADRQAARLRNGLGKVIERWDEAGVARINRHDFKGNVLSKTRRVVDDAVLAALGAQEQWIPDWSQANSDAALDTTDYDLDTTFDALSRPTTLTYPQDVNGNRRSLKPRYNGLGALEAISVTRPGATDEEVVSLIAYNAKGQRTLVAYGNGTMTRYAYDPRSLRLARLLTERLAPPQAPLEWRGQGPAIQDSAYTYDLAGNLIAIDERVPNCGIEGGGFDRDRLTRTFTYDAVYRLASASGRAWVADTEVRRRSDLPSWGFRTRTSAPNQANAPDMAESYREEFDYDPAGNMLNHAYRRDGTVTWRRRFGMAGLAADQWAAATDNHLTTVTIGLTEISNVFDSSGNTTRTNTAEWFVWDHADRLIGYRRQPAGAATPSTVARYLYDSDGLRVKKWVRSGGGAVAAESTTYIGSEFEHHRSNRIAGGSNNTTHIVDGEKRIAMIRAGNPHDEDAGPVFQYQIADPLGSVAITMGGPDALGDTFIHREEFFAFGETSLGSFGRKRYRFSSKERNEENGLAYHGARYYVPWQARWLSCDPLGPVDGLNLYWYTRNSPLLSVDGSGYATRTVGPRPSFSGEWLEPPAVQEFRAAEFGIEGVRTPPATTSRILGALAESAEGMNVVTGAIVGYYLLLKNSFQQQEDFTVRARRHAFGLALYEVGLMTQADIRILVNTGTLEMHGPGAKEYRDTFLKAISQWGVRFETHVYNTGDDPISGRSFQDLVASGKVVFQMKIATQYYDLRVPDILKLGKTNGVYEWVGDVKAGAIRDTPQTRAFVDEAGKSERRLLYFFVPGDIPKEFAQSLVPRSLRDYARTLRDAKGRFNPVTIEVIPVPGFDEMPPQYNPVQGGR